MTLSGLFSRRSPEEKALAKYIHSTFGFYPKNMALYQLAFTHKSKSGENIGKYHLSNERLEYLGDAVLSAAVADYLFRTYPTQSEGFLTEMRSRIVSRASLNNLSQKLHFEDHIHYVADNSKFPSFRSLGGNVFEALMGAIYLDHDFDFTKRVIIDRIIRTHIDLEDLQQTEINFKSRILEWAQKDKVKKHIEFRLLDEEQLKNKKLFHVQVFVDDNPYADAIDYSIKRAEQHAAEKTLDLLAKDVSLSHESQGKK
ncbi:MAG: ribonuclease III [Bacteroidales bacterium]|nr:ribonuclease III [Bacteroidales bacterium]